MLLYLRGCYFCFFFSMLLLGNRYNAEFSVDHKGISYKSGIREQRINRIVLLLLLLTRSRMSGSGFLAIAGESGYFSWGEIYKVISYEKSRVIELKNNWRTLVRLYCTDDNFYQVSELCHQYLNKANNLGPKKSKIISKKNIHFYFFWIILSSLFSFLSAAWTHLDYGDFLYRFLFLIFIITIISGLFFRRWIGNIFSSVAIMGILYFLYELYCLAYEKTEILTGYLKYGYEYDSNKFFITLFGVLSLLSMNFYNFFKRNK